MGSLALWEENENRQFRWVAKGKSWKVKYLKSWYIVKFKEASAINKKLWNYTVKGIWND